MDELKNNGTTEKHSRIYSGVMMTSKIHSWDDNLKCVKIQYNRALLLKTSIWDFSEEKHNTAEWKYKQSDLRWQKMKLG